MEPLRIKDNSKVGKDELDKIPNLTGRIEDRTLENLEREGVFVFPEAVREAEDITGEQMVLQSRDGSYWSSNVMGFLGYGDERLTIESRFSGDGEDHFLPYLLGKALGLPNILDLMTVASFDRRDPLNFLALLFPYCLKKAMRKGVYREYTRNLYNDANVKGPIDVARHIRLNTPFTGKVAYSQRELSCDNGLTELVRHTAEFIRGKPYGNKILIHAKDEVRLITEATPGYKPSDRQRVIGQNGKNPVRHAYFREYLALQRLCLQILRDQRHRIGDGGNRIYGVLFDGAWLWEEYVNSLIGDGFHHPMNRSQKGEQYLFTVEGTNNKKGRIYPDFISKRDDPRIIADAKYKPVKNIGNKDYLQVLAYMFRFDAKEGYYLYPYAEKEAEKEGAADLTLLMNRGVTVTYEDNVSPREDIRDNVSPREDIRLTKLGLKIPQDATDYGDFVEKIQESERKFQEPFKQLGGG